MKMPPPTVAISFPKANAVLAGRVPVLATTTADEGYGYAIFSVDSIGQGISNALPLQFDLNTTLFSNGAHTLRVDIGDTSGIISSSLSIPVVILNLASMYSRSEPQAVNHTPAPPQPAIPIAVLLDGKPLQFPFPPIINDGRTLVALRPLITSAGGTLAWDARKRCVTIKLKQHEVLCVAGQQQVTIDNRVVMLDRPLTIHNGSMLVPVTVWRDLFAGSVHFDYTYHAIILRSHAALVLAKIAK